MKFLDFVVTKEDFDAYPWQDAILKASKQRCYLYVGFFQHHAQECEKNKDERGQRIYTLLNAVTSLAPKFDSLDEPFCPMWRSANSRTAILNDFTDSHLQVFRELAPITKDAELRARLADVVWVRKRDHEMGGLAVDAYLKLGAVIRDVKSWPEYTQRIDRALQVAAQLGRKNEPFKKVIACIERLLDKHREYGTGFLTAHLMELLLDHALGDAAKYSLIAEELAKKAETEGNSYVANIYWGLMARWASTAKDHEKQRQALIKAAEAKVAEAESALKRDPPSYMAAAGLLVNAIEAYRRIPDTKDRVAELHKQLLEYQEKSLAEMQTFSHEIDMADLVKHAQDAVRGQPLERAIVRLTLLASSPPIADVRKYIVEAAEQFPMQHLFTSVAVDQKGRTTARRPAMLTENLEEREAAIEADMLQHAQLYRQLTVQGRVVPALSQITSEHNIRTRDLAFLVRNNPFIPPGHEGIFQKGFYAGFTSDFITAAHLLVPQVENSIRYVLTQAGKITSGINAQMVQEEHDINRLLEWPEVKAIFGDDLVFDLKGLLISRFGANFRNRLAHGLIPDLGFYAVESVYSWWLILKICVLPIIQVQPEQPPASSKPAGEQATLGGQPA